MFSKCFQLYGKQIYTFLHKYSTNWTTSIFYADFTLFKQFILFEYKKFYATLHQTLQTYNQEEEFVKYLVLFSEPFFEANSVLSVELNFSLQYKNMEQMQSRHYELFFFKKCVLNTHKIEKQCIILKLCTHR